MIVCQCRVVSDRDIRAAIAGGATGVCAVADACRAGAGCGGCLPLVRDMLAEQGLPTDEHLTPGDIRRELARMAPVTREASA